MAQLIQMIDAVSRKRRMDVLFLAILNGTGQPTRDHPALGEATDWLTAQGFGWQICGAFQQGWINMGGGKRVIFIDTPYLPGSDTLERLDARFETKDGTPRNPGLVLTVLTLAEAMTNAAQDEPGFWDNV